MNSGPKKPKEDPSVGVLRERQIRDLAGLDEEENRRLKPRFRSSIRAFRTASGSGSGGSAGAGGSTGGGSEGRRVLNPKLPGL